MKTQVKTVKGATAVIEFKDDRFYTKIIGGPNFKSSTIRINGGVAHVADTYQKGGSHRIELHVDSENEAILVYTK